MKTVITVIVTTPWDTAGVGDAISAALNDPGNYPPEVDVSDWDVQVNDTPDGAAEQVRQGHRAAALQLVSDWAGSASLTDRERDLDSLGAALVQAVLALSAPTEKTPEPGSWRQRAEEAEAALTAIGGVISRPGPAYPLDRISGIAHILRTAGREADRLMAPAAHTGMRAHDGYCPHSHEVRPDHDGVPRGKP